MEKGYYKMGNETKVTPPVVVAIHNKNGKGLLQKNAVVAEQKLESQSTIKMEKGYYFNKARLLEVAAVGRNPQ